MTDLYAAAERLMGMDETAWTRHANPWSGYSRFLTSLPLLTLALWSRVWIGWGALVPVAAALAWIWLNPRAFPPPRDYGSWMSRGVLGERLWLARDRLSIPRHHLRMAWITTSFAASGLPIYLYGVIALEVWPTLMGMTLAVVGKAWFCDRMVWIHAEMTGTVPGEPLPDPRLPEGARP